MTVSCQSFDLLAGPSPSRQNQLRTKKEYSFRRSVENGAHDFGRFKSTFRHENKTLRGRKLQTVRKIIEQRKTKGKKFNPGHKSKEERVPTADGLVRVYRQEADRQKDIVRKARLTENRLLFIVTALKKLFHDENFLTLLRAEQLDTLPTYLAERIPIPVASTV